MVGIIEIIAKRIKGINAIFRIQFIIRLISVPDGAVSSCIGVASSANDTGSFLSSFI